MLNDRYKFGVILLAAGLSTRMRGENKLLKVWRSKPVLSYSLEVVRGLNLEQVVLVGGHMMVAMKEQFDLDGISLVHNTEPEQGMAGSIVLGVETLEENIDGVFVCLGDMPLVSQQVFQALSEAFDPEDGDEICVPVYQGQQGHPVLFGQRFFPMLEELRGDKGARKVIEAHRKCLVSVEVAHSGVVFDLDRVEDFEE